MQRRDFLAGASAVGFAALAQAAPAAPGKRVSLGFSLYGMKSLSLADAVKTCQDVGYDCIELPVMKDWPGAAETLTGASLEHFRSACKLPVVALMENLRLLVEDAEHAKNLDRLRRACKLAHGLKADQAPLIETILGGAPKQWDNTKQQMVDRLGEWAQICAAAKITLAIKAHAGNAAHLPEHVVWLLDQVNNDALVAAYDYSHFELRGLSLADSLQTLIGRTRFIHVKDATGNADKFKFLLPGEGKTDYAEYLKLLQQHDYAGPLVVEVSGQIHSQPAYDPIATARQCYKTLSSARERAGR